MTICLKEFGVVCALGNDKQQVLKALIGEDKKYLSLDSELPIDAPQYVGRVGLPADLDVQQISTNNNKLAYIAYQQIADALQPLISQYGEHRVAVVIGTSTASIYEGELARKELATQGQFPSDFKYEVQEMSAPATYIATLANAKGPVYGISTACSSSGKALVSASTLLDNDLADAKIALQGAHVDWWKPKKHLLDIYAEKCGVSLKERRPVIYLNDSDFEEAKKKLNELGISNDDKFLILSPETRSKKKMKEWPYDRFLSLIQKIHQNHGWLAGTHRDRRGGFYRTGQWYNLVLLTFRR